MRTNDYVRSFGMSGLLIADEIRELEKRFDIDLGHIPRGAQQRAAEYYPQFERDVRKEAAQMAQHYELFYCLEQAIRKLITETLEETEGANWWNTKVSPEIQKYVADLQKGELDNGFTPRSERAIDYTTFGHLS